MVTIISTMPKILLVTGPWVYEILYTVNANDFSSALAASNSGELFLVASGNDGGDFHFEPVIYTDQLTRPPGILIS